MPLIDLTMGAATTSDPSSVAGPLVVALGATVLALRQRLAILFDSKHRPRSERGTKVDAYRRSITVLGILSVLVGLASIAQVLSD